jgi:hypothetical protein
MAALVLSLLLIGIMLLETRRYRRMAAESAELAARAEAASRAKSRFLTMMSHELRTPMNGVLGLLALARFSDLQSESLVMARDMFEVHGLARAVEEMFGPIVQREGVEFTVGIDADTPRWVVGDLTRLRQVLGHFVTFLVDVVGSKDVRLAISGVRNGLTFEIDVAVQGSDQPGWQPEAMFGRGSEHYGDFASDSLGPMIARGLVSLMKGTVAIKRAVAGRAILSIFINIRIEAESVTAQMVLAALLRKVGCGVWEPGTPNRKVTAVLLEAGGEEETVRAARLRSDHPSARLIAVGTPQSAGLFDAVETLSAAISTGADVQSVVS